MGIAGLSVQCYAPMSRLAYLFEFMRGVLGVFIDVLTFFCLIFRSSVALAAESLFSENNSRCTLNEGRSLAVRPTAFASVLIRRAWYRFCCAHDHRRLQAFQRRQPLAD